MDLDVRPRFEWKRFTISSAAVLALSIALMTASFGSTKVYTADGTIHHGQATHNVSDTRVFTVTNEAVLPDNSTVNLADAGEKRFTALAERQRSSN